MASSISNHTATRGRCHQGGLVARHHLVQPRLPSGDSWSSMTAEKSTVHRRNWACRPSSTAAAASRAFFTSLCATVDVEQPAADPRRTGRCPYGSRHPLRKHRPSHCRSRPAVRRHRRHPGAAHFGIPVLGDRDPGTSLLVGIVKKNAIIMIDVAIHLPAARRPRRAECAGHRKPIPACRSGALAADHDDDRGCRVGCAPLAIGIGQGASLRQPLGITVMGSLM